VEIQRPANRERGRSTPPDCIYRGPRPSTYVCARAQTCHPPPSRLTVMSRPPSDGERSCYRLMFRSLSRIIFGSIILYPLGDGPPHGEPPDHYERRVDSARLVSLARHASLCHCIRASGRQVLHLAVKRCANKRVRRHFADAPLISDQPELTISAPPLLFGRRPPPNLVCGANYLSF
jgi:hypothetical protein